MGRRVEGEAGRGGGRWTGRRRADGEAGGGGWTRRRGGDKAVPSPSPCMARSPEPRDLGQREAAPPLGTSPEQQIRPTAWLWALAPGSPQPPPQHLSMNRCPFPVHPRLPTLMAPTRDQQGCWGVCSAPTVPAPPPTTLSTPRPTHPPALPPVQGPPCQRCPRPCSPRDPGESPAGPPWSGPLTAAGACGGETTGPSRGPSAGRGEQRRGATTEPGLCT